LFASLELSDLSPLLNAEDPFSLLLGFEICRVRIEGNAAFIELGTQFLEKLFGEPETCNARLGIYAACAIITTNEVRKSAKATNKPIFWIHLAALAHAGVLTQGLIGLPDPKGFLNWAADRFLPHYVWTCIVDRREAPRWKPEWISPDHLMTELFGRTQNVLHSLPENLRPTPWVALFEKVSAPLIESGRILAAVFPGQFDNFHGGPVEGLRSEQFEDIENQLEAAFAFAMQPSEKATKNMLRILISTFEQPVKDVAEELSHLQIASHFALVSRSEEIADAIKGRAFVLLYDAKGLDLVTDLFSVIAETCAVKRDAIQYRQILCDAATKMCFFIDETEALSKLLLVFDVLVQRDEKLAPVLAKAKAIAKTKIGRC
uniref:hypothetical protein n=1 Tax=Breoghania sp. TaxID=2065378 RepID=UPI00262655A2